MSEPKGLQWARWLTEAEAAEYCRCSLWAFRRMGLPANNSGGRKVYFRETLDACIHARPWSREPRVVPNSPLDARLSAIRLRPYKPRTKSAPSE